MLTSQTIFILQYNIYILSFQIISQCCYCHIPILLLSSNRWHDCYPYAFFALMVLFRGCFRKLSYSITYSSYYLSIFLQGFPIFYGLNLQPIHTNKSSFPSLGIHILFQSFSLSDLTLRYHFPSLNYNLLKCWHL